MTARACAFRLSGQLSMFLLAALLLPLGAMASERVALVIGNAAYQTAPLKNPVNDARAISTRLEALGFVVTRLENATRAEMGDAIARFEQSLGPDKVALFYFAGHGIQVRNRNFLVPVDADLRSESRARYEAVDVGGVVEAMEFAKSKVNFILLDACRDNPFRSSMRSAKRGLAPVDAARGTLIAYATAPGDVADDGDGDNGLYTASLLDALKVPGLTAEEVFKRVRASVDEQTNGQQTPWESSSLTGNFIFNALATINIVEPKPDTTKLSVELAYWNSIQASQSVALLEAYLRRYPDGQFAEIAAIKVAELRAVETARRAAEIESASAAAEQPVPAKDAETKGVEAKVVVPKDVEAKKVPDSAAVGSKVSTVAMAVAPEPSKAERIATLLAAAKADIAALRLTSPAQRNAVRKYRRVLALDPHNAEVETGLKAVGEKYVELAERAVRRGRRVSALRYLDRAETVRPGLASVAEARASLEQPAEPKTGRSSAAPPATSASGQAALNNEFTGARAQTPATTTTSGVASVTSALKRAKPAPQVLRIVLGPIVGTNHGRRSPGHNIASAARAVLNNDDGLGLSADRSFGRTPDWSGFFGGMSDPGVLRQLGRREGVDGVLVFDYTFSSADDFDINVYLVSVVSGQVYSVKSSSRSRGDYHLRVAEITQRVMRRLRTELY